MVRIYKITNRINNKIYIGQTCQDIERRFKQHSRGVGLGVKMPIHLAIEKYGKENFSIEVICSCYDKESAGQLEIYFINFFNCLAPNGYNVDFNTKYIKDNPYLIREHKTSLAVQSLGSESEKSEYNLPTRPRYPYEFWMEVKNLYEEGYSPSDINKLLNINIPNYTITNKMKDLGCDTTNKSRNRFRGKGKYSLSEEEKYNIITDFKSGISCVELEKKYNRSSRPIKRILVDAGLLISKDKKISRTLE